MSYLDVNIGKMQFPDEPPFIRSPRLRSLLGLPEVKKPPILIEGLHLSVEKASFVSFIGVSGAGKTTLLRIIAGLENRYQGTVTLNGNQVLKPSRQIQIVFQDNCLLPWRTVEDNVAFATHGLSEEAMKLRIQEWLQNVSLDGMERNLPKTLSGGEASRVAFARTFVDPPQVLLLDEPFRALDPKTKLDLQQKLLEFVRDNNTTVLLVSHSIDDAVFLSDRVYRVSTSPMRIAETIPVLVQRPRTRGDSRLIEIATRLTQTLTHAE